MDSWRVFVNFAMYFSKDTVSSMKKLAIIHHFSIDSLKKVESILSGREKPSAHTLDRLALLAGFQSWKDLQEALHGTAE